MFSLVIYKIKKLENCFKMGASFIKDPLIFDNNEGNYMCINSPYRRLQTICKKVAKSVLIYEKIRDSKK